jgi:hypothetical protein
MELTWEQKAQALQALVGWSNFALKMRDIGNWYVQTTGLELKKGVCLSGSCVHAQDPQQAVALTWKWATELEPDTYLVVNAYRDNRRAVRWNGFMWEDVVEEK